MYYEKAWAIRERLSVRCQTFKKSLSLEQKIRTIPKNPFLEFVMKSCICYPIRFIQLNEKQNWRTYRSSQISSLDCTSFRFLKLFCTSAISLLASTRSAKRIKACNAIQKLIFKRNCNRNKPNVVIASKKSERCDIFAKKKGVHHPVNFNQWIVLLRSLSFALYSQGTYCSFYFKGQLIAGLHFTGKGSDGFKIEKNHKRKLYKRHLDTNMLILLLKLF